MGHPTIIAEHRPPSSYDLPALWPDPSQDASDGSRLAADQGHALEQVLQRVLELQRCVVLGQRVLETAYRGIVAKVGASRGAVVDDIERTDVEATRADLSRNLDELTDKVNPQRVVQRRKDAARQGLSSVKDKVMGSAQDARDRVSGGTSSGAGSVKGSAQQGVGALESTTAGNPITAGLVAFGAGMLISALLPASTKEAEAARRVVETAKEQGQPLLDDVKSRGQDLGKDLGDKAAQAAQDVKAQAQDSAANVKQEAQESAGQVKDDARSS